jgi:glycosyltransferase involved in cell wall biosynthesis
MLAHAVMFHATADAEAESLRRSGFQQPIAVIPNGVAVPERERVKSTSAAPRRALFLSRLHPKKGLPMLIEAWARVEPKDWELVLVGPSEDGHRAELEKQVRQRGLGEAVTFRGPVADDAKWSEYRKADLFVLPTHSENFGIVVAEAMAAGLPVITTTGAPWEELETHGCGWWVEPEVDSIKQALKEAVHCTDEERRAMGKRGRQLVKEHYSWQGVAERMIAAYHWLLGSESRPDHVQLN